MTDKELLAQLIDFRNITVVELQKISKIDPRPEYYKGFVEGMDAMVFRCTINLEQEKENADKTLGTNEKDDDTRTQG